MEAIHRIGTKYEALLQIHVSIYGAQLENILINREVNRIWQQERSGWNPQLVHTLKWCT
jgi:hypothetical protein